MTIISGIFTLFLLPIQTEPLFSIPHSLNSLAGLLYGTFIGMAVCQAIWFFLLKRLEPSAASLLLLSIPPLGSLFSWLLVDAKLTLIDLISLSLLTISAVLSCVKFDTNEK